MRKFERFNKQNIFNSIQVHPLQSALLLDVYQSYLCVFVLQSNRIFSTLRSNVDFWKRNNFAIKNKRKQTKKKMLKIRWLREFDQITLNSTPDRVFQVNVDDWRRRNIVQVSSSPVAVSLMTMRTYGRRRTGWMDGSPITLSHSSHFLSHTNIDWFLSTMTEIITSQKAVILTQTTTRP